MSLAALLLTPLFAQQEAPAKVSGVFATLKAGQTLNVKETGERYLPTVIEGESKLPQSHAVLEVDHDFVVVKVLTGLNETRRISSRPFRPREIKPLYLKEIKPLYLIIRHRIASLSVTWSSSVNDPSVIWLELPTISVRTALTTGNFGTIGVSLRAELYGTQALHGYVKLPSRG